MVSTPTLLKVATVGAVIVTATGYHLQQRIVDSIRKDNYYKDALKILRTNAGAVFVLGEPIKDGRFKLSDSENNFCDGKNAKFSIPVSGSKARGTYYFWAERNNDKWTITKAELEVKNQPDKRLAVVKDRSSSSSVLP